MDDEGKRQASPPDERRVPLEGRRPPISAGSGPVREGDGRRARLAEPRAVTRARPVDGGPLSRRPGLRQSSFISQCRREPSAILVICSAKGSAAQTPARPSPRELPEAAGTGLPPRDCRFGPHTHERTRPCQCFSPRTSGAAGRASQRSRTGQTGDLHRDSDIKALTHGFPMARSLGIKFPLIFCSPVCSEH